MPKSAFLIKMSRLDNDLEKVSLLMDKFNKDMIISGYRTPGFSFSAQSSELKSFRQNLTSLLGDLPAVDFFGNKKRSISDYEYVEIIVDQNFKRFVALRMLGTKDTNPNRDKTLPVEKQRRYAVFDIENKKFSPTTLNIVSDIELLSDSTQETFDLKKGGFTVLSDITWSEFLSKYTFPKVEKVASNSPINNENLKFITERFNETSVKTAQQVQEEELLWASADFKNSLIRTREGGFELNNSSAIVLSDVRGLQSKLNALGAAYTEVFDKISIASLVQTAIECIMPPITCKDALRGIRVDNLADKIKLAFPNQPRLTSLIEQEIDKVKGLPEAEATDAFLDGIENFIDIEAICDFILNFSIPEFTIPTIELPDLPIVDLFGSVSIAIEDAILQALIKAILEMLLGLLEDLLACDNLDAFIAGALTGELPTDNAVTNDLNLLFTDPAGVLDPEKGAIAGRLGDRWAEFENEAEVLLENVVSVDGVAGVSALGGVLTTGTTLDADIGIGNVADVLRGSFPEITGSAVFDSFIQGEIDFNELLRNSQFDSPQMREFVKEIGRFELSEDGESLTLRRISDDQVVTILKTAFRRPRVELEISGRKLVDTLGRLLDDVAAILAPSETIRLLAGQPSSEAIDTISGIIELRYADLEPIRVPGLIKGLFGTLGETTGLNDLEDALVLAGTNPPKKIPTRKFCIEDDLALDLQRDILGRKLTPEEANDVIDDIIKKRKDRFNDLGDILTDSNVEPPDIVEQIICGLDPSTGERPPLVDDALDTTFNSIFEPVKMAFDREISVYPETLADYVTVSREIPRLVDSDENQPVLGGLLPIGSNAVTNTLNIFGGLGDLLEGTSPSKKMNPEFRQMVSEGFIPTNRNGSPDGDPNDGLGPYANPGFFGENNPIIKREKVREIGNIYKAGMKLDNKLTVSDKSKSIRGVLPLQSDENSYIGRTEPNNAIWTIDYEETGDKYNLKIDATGDIRSQFYGTVPFSERYELVSQSLSKIVTDSHQDLPQDTDADFYASFMASQLKSAVSNLSDEQEEQILGFFAGQRNDYEKALITQTSNAVRGNRLLREVPANNLQILGAAGSDPAKTANNKVYVIDYVNFAPTPTDEQKREKCDPHLLDLEFIKQRVKEQYDEDCKEEREESFDGMSPQRTPLNSSGLLGVVLTTIRLYAIEYVLRSLYLYDEYSFNPSFTKDPLILDYISSRMGDDLKRQGYYKEFEKEAIEVYRKMVDSGDIVPKDDLPKNKREKMQALMEHQLSSVFEAMAKLLGRRTGIPANSTAVTLGSLRVFDVYDEDANNKRLTEIFAQEDGRTRVRRLLEEEFTQLNEIVQQTTDYFNSLIEPPDGESEQSGDVSLFGLLTGSLSSFVPNFAEVAGDIGIEQFDAIRNLVNDPEDVFGFDALSAIGSEVVGSDGGKWVLERYIREPSPVGSVVQNISVIEDRISAQTENNSEEALGGESKTIEEHFDGKLKFGLRLVYVYPTSQVSAKKSALQIKKNKIEINNNLLNIRPGLAEREKAYYFLERQDSYVDEIEGLIDVTSAFTGVKADDLITYKPYNSIVLASAEKELNDFEKLEEVNKYIAKNSLNKLFKDRYEFSLLSELSKQKDVQNLVNNVIGGNTTISLLAIHSSMILNNERMKFLFEGTKEKLRKMFKNLLGMGDYGQKSEEQVLDGVPGNAGLYKSEFDRIGSPAGPRAPDALYYAMITPILILKGLAIITEPNIYIADKIVAAGAAGYLLPRFMRNNANEIIVGADGFPKDVWSPVIIYDNNGAEVPVKASDRWYVDSETKNLFDPKEVPRHMQVHSDTGEPIVPEIYNNVVNVSPENPLIGLDPNNIDGPPIASAPVFPGESINLPYGLVSMGLLPINFFGLFVPWLFCGPPLGPIGQYFLALEPLLWQMPHYKIAQAKTDTAEKIKEEYGIDLTNSEKC